ncbi:ribonuclease H-like domain-containing protein [Tanacetum coccineum]
MARSDDDIPPPSQTQTPTQQTPHTVSTIKLPILKKGEYDIWAMKMEHYLAHTDYPIWEVIQRGNGPVSVSTYTNGVIKVLPPKTAEEILARERERKARTTLLMALPEDHLAKFYKMTDAKEMWEAIKSRFGGNDESKKMQKFQSLLSQLEIHGAGVSTEDANQKFLRSLPSAWSQAIESDVKGSTASSSSTQNVAFVSENTSSTNDVSTAYGVSTSTGHNSQCENPSSYSFLANQSSCPQLDHEDLEQLDEFDLEEMDLKWQVAMISMRMKKFYKKTGRKLQFDAKEPVGFDKTKVECYNCHKTGHFARECRSKGNQDSRRRDAWNTGNKDKDNGRRSGKQEEPKALVTLDGDGVDWTSHSEDEQENYALMAYSNSGSDTEVTSCSKECKESYAKLKKLYDEQREQLGDASIEIQAYTQALKKVEAQLVTHQQNQLWYEEKIRFMKINLDDKTDVLTYHKKLLAKAEKEKEELKAKVEKWHNSSKSLNILLNSQMSARDKAVLGYGDQIYKCVLSYENEVFGSLFDSRSSDLEDRPVNDRYAEGMHAVPPPMIGIYIPSRPDKEIDDSQFTYCPNEETLESVPELVVNEPKVVTHPKVWSDSPIIEEYESNSDDEHFSHLNRNVNFHEKRMAKQAELNKRMCKGTGQRENRPVWNNVQRVNHQNQFVPTTVLTRTGIIQVNTARTSGTNTVNTARHNFNSKDYPQRALKNKGIVDSGCSRHMTGNKAHLAEYQDYNGGPVAFEGSKGYITGKGKIKIGKLDFEDVCFVKQLHHFNLFSVSQMCDKKNKVLFTDTECLVLSPEFMLPDENQVLLRVPRQNNMYSFNLENTFPSGGLAYLISKATVDESNKWHRRLGHVNLKNLNKLVKVNLVRGNSKMEVESAQDYFVLPIRSSYTSTIKSSEAKNEAEALRKEFAQDTKDLLLQAGDVRASSTNTVNTTSTPVSTASPFGGLSFTNLTNTDQDDSEIPALKDSYDNPNDGIFTNASYDDEGALADFINLETIVNLLKDESWFECYARKNWLAIHISKEEGIDYDKVFAPVARIEAIRIFLAFASYMGFIVYQMDVKSAFMYGKIDEKSGYKRGTIDKTLFIKKDKNDIMLVQVYADDIIFGSTKRSWCDEFEALMKSRFQMSSMGELTFFLGLQVKQKEDGIFISHDKYVAEILKKFDFMSVKTASTPNETQKPLVKDKEVADVDVHLYRSMFGSLMYLTASRPDIMFAVCACSRFQVTPKTSHLNVVKRIFRNCRSKGPAMGSNLLSVSVTCHACGEKGHYKSQCSSKTDNGTSHVSKKSLCDESLIIPKKEIWLDDKLNYMDRESV